jgi:flagellar basal body rod protein FlgG
MDVSTYLSLNALIKAQDMVAAVAEDLSNAGPSIEAMTSLLIAEDIHAANVNVIKMSDEMLGNIIDMVA